MGTRQCQCQPCMVCLQSGSVSADGVISFSFFFFFFTLVCISYFQKPCLEKKKKKKGREVENILLVGFWVMSWPVVMACGDAWWVLVELQPKQWRVVLATPYSPAHHLQSVCFCK